MSVFSVDNSFENAWINGKKGNVIETDNRGLAYGDGFFETIRIVKGLLVLEELHWERIKITASRLGFDLDIDELQRHVTFVMQENKCWSGVMKVMVIRHGRGRGYEPKENKWCSIIRMSPLPDYPKKHWEEGIALYPCKTMLGYQPLLAGIKHLNRLEQVLASIECASTGCVEGLVCDYHGNVIEGIKSNLFLVHKNTIMTPELSECGVNGVMRQWIMSLTSLPYKITITKISKEMLKNALEVFVCNSIIGVWPVLSCGDMRWFPGKITRDIQKETERLFHDP